MQRYKNNLNILSEFVEFLKYKIDSGKLSLAEVEGLKRAFTENLTLTGTAEDIAKFYDRSPQDVRNIVHRKMFSKPERKVYYSFNEFSMTAPPSWKKK